MTRSAILLLVPLLAGCNLHSRNPAAGNDNVSIHADGSGNIAFNLPVAEGQVKVPASFLRNGNVDIDGVKLMPGSAVTGFNVDAANGSGKVDLSFTAPAPPDQVRAYFVDQFNKQGVEAAISGDSVTGKSKDGGAFAIHVAQAANGSQGKIVMEDKD